MAPGLVRSLFAPVPFGPARRPTHHCRPRGSRNLHLNLQRCGPLTRDAEVYFTRWPSPPVFPPRPWRESQGGWVGTLAPGLVRSLFAPVPFGLARRPTHHCRPRGSRNLHLNLQRCGPLTRDAEVYFTRWPSPPVFPPRPWRESQGGWVGTLAPGLIRSLFAPVPFGPARRPTHHCRPRGSRNLHLNLQRCGPLTRDAEVYFTRWPSPPVFPPRPWRESQGGWVGTLAPGLVRSLFAPVPFGPARRPTHHCRPRGSRNLHLNLQRCGPLTRDAEVYFTRWPSPPVFPPRPWRES